MENRIKFLINFYRVVEENYFLFFPTQEEEEQTKKQVQTSFTVKLTGFDDKQKVALIKEIKSLLPDTNLVQVLSYRLFKYQIQYY